MSVVRMESMVAIDAKDHESLHDLVLSGFAWISRHVGGTSPSRNWVGCA
jgi:hypothetical protein